MIDRPDPFPRELIDVWPLHDARQELLEEIVSQPGNDQSSTRRILVPAGIAAALLLVVGGAWAAIGAGGDDNGDNDVAASVVSTAVESTTPTTEASATDSVTDSVTDSATGATTDGSQGNGAGPHDGRSGRKVTLQDLDECLRVLSRRADGPKDSGQLRRLEHHKGRGYTVYVVRQHHRIVAVDGHCHARLVKGGRVGGH